MTGLALALLLLGQASPAIPDYDALVSLGLESGRAGQLSEARAAFDRAIALDPQRPQAWVERGGVSFIEKKYDEASRDLQRALAIEEDPYTRDLLASALHLAGRTDEALQRWNTLGQPVLRSVEITGLVHTKDRVARREISLTEGQLLDVGRLRESRLRLSELGIFDRETLRPVPRGDGQADLEVALTERHGLYRSWVEAAVTTGANAIGRRVRLRYANLDGTGVSFGAQFRWQQTRREWSVFFDWPRPLGLPAYLHVLAFRGRQAYDLDEPLTRHSRGLDLGLRHVVGPRTVGVITLRARERTFSRPRLDAPPGRLVGLEGGLEHRLVETRRQRLDATARIFQGAGFLGSEISYPRALLGARYRILLAPPEGKPIERSLLAAQALWGRGGPDMPLDEMFAPGGSQEMEYPLRAHRQARHGILGGTPLGRALTLGNLEWRRRLLDRPALQMGVVAFCDAGHIAETAERPRRRTLIDVGFGLRLSLGGSAILRVDYGRGLADGKNALFVGLNNVF